MDAREEALQLKKLAGIDKMVILLEEIAFNTSSKMIERKTYLERVYASGKSSPTEVHGDVRTQPATRQREVPQHDPTAISRVRLNAPSGSPEKKVN